jgi:hypothetical protein
MNFARPAIGWRLCVLPLLVCGAALAADEAQAQPVIIGRTIKDVEPPPTPATYAEREAQLFADPPCESESLALPWIRALRYVRPHRTAVGERAWNMPGSLGERRPVGWRTVPWTAACDEFLRQYDELHQDFQMDRPLGYEWERKVVQLSFWCEKNSLSDAAEFLLREVLYLRQLRQSRQMEGDVKRWRALAARRPSPYTFRLPVDGPWHASVDVTRHHQRSAFSAFAFDLVVSAGNGTTFVGPNVRENHLAWNQPVLAVADGVIVSVKDDFVDRPIDRAGPKPTANTIQLDCGGGVYANYAHLRQDSALVKAGDRVVAGQPLGRVGNSGFSGSPHLHFAMSDYDGLSLPGRYHLTVLSTSGWRKLSGIDIEEGWHFMPH